jgi:hypothetical protein
LLPSIEESISSCGLNGEAINVMWKWEWERYVVDIYAIELFLQTHLNKLCIDWTKCYSLPKKT